MIIGVDLGGTNIRAGIIVDGKVIKSASRTLNNKESLESTIEQLESIIESLMSDKIRGIGLGVPSIVDIEKGIVYDVVNIPSWKNVELKKILEEKFQIPVYINNDVNCFALGEQFYGSAKCFSSFVALSLGTGLGSAIVINNKLMLGVNCGAGEIGYIPYLDKNLEYYTSGSFFETFSMTAYEAYTAACSGDIKALEVWKQYGEHMGNVIKIILYTYDPEAIVFGGSISKAFQFFEKSMNQCMEDFMFPAILKQIKIIKSTIENIALLGAAALVPVLG